MTFDAYHYERELRIANTILQHADSPEVRKSAQEAIDFWEKRLAKFYETGEEETGEKGLTNVTG